MSTFEFFPALSDATLHAGSVCGYMGSFDPPHRGHQWISSYLADRFELVVLLVPIIHFEKSIVYPHNALIPQRIGMLDIMGERIRERTVAAVTSEILFLEIELLMSAIWPDATINFGMGSDTYGKFLNSERYYRRCGKAWRDRECERVRNLTSRIVVFNRTKRFENGVDVPEPLRMISSTTIRCLIGELRATEAPLSDWTTALMKMVPEAMIPFLYKSGLYVNNDE